MSTYDVEWFDVMGQAWVRHHRLFGFKTRHKANIELTKLIKRLKKENKKADSDWRPEALGAVTIPKYRIVENS